MRARSVVVFFSMIIVAFLLVTVQKSFAAVQARTHNAMTDNAGLLSVTQDVSLAQAKYGDILTYTIALTNTSAITPVNVLVTDTLLSSLSFVPSSLSASEGNAQFSSGVITWSDTLTPSANALISFQARVVKANTTITNSFLIDEGDSGVYNGPTVSTDVAPVQSFLPLVFNNYCSGPYVDDFSNPASGWPIADTTYWSDGYVNGEYRFYAKSAAWGAVTRGDMGNPVVEVDARQVSTVNGSYGIAYYIVPDWSHFGTFEIYPATRQYAWWQYASGNWYLYSYGTSTAINPGQGTNHLKIVDIGPRPGGTNTYDFYVNGTMLFEDPVGIDPSFLQTLRSGLIATADATGFDVRFDNYKFVPAGCPANFQTSVQRSNQSLGKFFEMRSIPSPIQRAWPMRLTRVPSPLDKYLR
jgi:uncharacterized repeat protein (TIGR01451 family)